ncbi:CDP-glycerol glycerophosphotransferase [Stackebrandtia albiflava]|uniref:CDP-glycerol glycerophosphotransferase n=1 Tax=Stackebrandtia albiflava TaxID=406432 RepID=A0A562V3E1_9ACTN|nr:bifunctional glycosyltransferase/CDP-glycerol:glycerophosphate glycerophosphotransferase [Stackebrandtia albiflava]TWJ12327.1 CDP-glycerol glycerophosphotransferase [Stackebrandtia albiflava]
MATLSVVVPIYNVEEFLRPALDSLANQTFDDLEVVMVDDGSTDGSGRIAAEYAESDKRFQLVTQANGGLSRARNTGAENATGKYMTFVDSDDLIPHYAFATAMRVLETTGSDFLTGRVSRLDSRGIFSVPMQRESHRESVLSTTVAKTPQLIRDLLAANKIYRRSFWDHAGLRFPDGLNFEDGPVSIRAHALATNVDVLNLPVYYWRLREGATRSISRQTSDAHFFVDRIATSIISIDLLTERRPELLEPFFAMDIRHKFGIMFRNLHHAPPPVREQFMSAAGPYLARVPSRVVQELPDALRRRVRLVADGDLAGLIDELADGGRKPVSLPGEGDETVRGALKKFTPLRVLKRYVGQSTGDAKSKGRLYSLGVDDGALELRGHAYIEGLPSEGRITAANRLFWARHLKSGTRVSIRFTSLPSPQATASVTDLSWGSAHSGYHARLPLSKLRDSDGSWRYGDWVFAVGALTARGAHTGGLRTGADFTDFGLHPIDVADDLRIVPTVVSGVLRLRLERPEVSITDVSTVDGVLRLRGTSRAPLTDAATLRWCRVPGVPELTTMVTSHHRTPEGLTEFTADLELAAVMSQLGPVQVVPVAGTQDRLFADLLPSPDAAPYEVRCSEGMSAGEGFYTGVQIVVDSDIDGRTALTLVPALPVITSARWSPDGVLELSGVGGEHVTGPELVCRHTGRKEERVLPIDVADDGGWSVRLDPEAAPLPAATVALRAGRWRLVLRFRDAQGDLVDTDLSYAPDAISITQGLPFGERYLVTRVGLEALILKVAPRRADDERGTYNMSRLSTIVYPEMARTLPLRDVVLYDSFFGKQYSDSPRALHEALRGRDDGLRHVWVTKDAQAPIPDGVERVEHGSRAWCEALATSRYVVASTHLPYWFRRREGQTVAQTWHGIGFKRVGFDIESVQFSNKAYLRKVAQETPNWSFLISPNAFSTEILRRAFRYEGEIIEIGSPRNDLLISGDRAELSRRLKDDLGIPQDRKLILYAPTWRDNEYHRVGQYKFDMRLDVSRFPARLKEEYALLVRRHPNTIDDLLGYGNGFVYDVANHPDVRQLLAAADVLISDYSTISLDFANTGRPIIFYTYDLAHYRDQLRGFYFDLENEGPGPVLETTDEVVEALCDLPKTQRDYAERYARIREIFGHAEDGHATDRFIERLFADRR